MTVIAQDALLARVPGRLPSTIEPEPGTAVSVPPHVLLKPLGVATTNPAGNVSLTLRASKKSAFGLLIVRVNDVIPPIGIRRSPNAFVMFGGATTKVLAEACPPDPL